MTKDEILEAARKANLYGIYQALDWYNEETEEGSFAYEEWDEQLELFAKLIAAAEREACAKVCEGKSPYWENCAAAIRARGEA